MKMAVVHSCLQLRETFNGKRQLRGLELNRLRFDGQRKDRRWQHFNPSPPDVRLARYGPQLRK